MKYLASLAWGVVLGTAAVLLHNAYQPFGLILSLLATGVGIWMVGIAWGKRHLKVIVTFGWFLIVLRATSLGVGNELLVQGNWNGNALLLVGVVTTLFAVATRVD